MSLTLLLMSSIALSLVSLANSACVADRCQGVVYDYPKINFKAGDKSIQCETGFFYSFFYDCPKSFQEGFSCEIKKNMNWNLVECQTLHPSLEHIITFGKGKIYSSPNFSISSATLECKTDDKGGIFLEKCVLGVTIDFLGNPWFFLVMEMILVISLLGAYKSYKDFCALKFQELRYNIQFRQQLDEMNSKATSKLYVVILLDVFTIILGIFYILTGHIALLFGFGYMGFFTIFSEAMLFSTDHLTKAKFIGDNQNQKVDVIVI